jgi:hypothetical protein
MAGPVMREAKQSMTRLEEWIASSLSLFATTVALVRGLRKEA